MFQFTYKLQVGTSEFVYIVGSVQTVYDWNVSNVPPEFLLDKDLCFLCFFDRASQYRLISFTNFNAQFLYSLTICMLHYNPRHVSSIDIPIFRRTNFIITASGIVTLCKRLYGMLQSILYSRLQRVTIPDTMIIKFAFLKMGMLMLETCRGL